MIHIVRARATKQQMDDMMAVPGTYIKLAMDIRREILAGGDALHADCEAVLLEDGSRQEGIWDADWDPVPKQVTYESLINIRPHLENRSLAIWDLKVRERCR